MKKKHLILLGVAALLLFSFRKKKTKGHVEVGDLDEGEFIDPATGEVITIKSNKSGIVLSKINEVFSDNDLSLQDDSYINAELLKLNDYQLSVLDDYFSGIINGRENIGSSEVDEIFRVTPNLSILLAQGTVVNNEKSVNSSGLQQRFDVDDALQLLSSVASGNIAGTLSGLSNLIGSIFCGKKCRMRRARQIRNVGVEV